MKSTSSTMMMKGGIDSRVKLVEPSSRSTSPSGLRAEDHGRGVVGQEVDQIETADRDDEDYAEQHHQTSYDVFQHSYPPRPVRTIANRRAFVVLPLVVAAGCHRRWLPWTGAENCHRRRHWRGEDRRDELPGRSRLARGRRRPNRPRDYRAGPTGVAGDARRLWRRRTG